MHRVLSKKQLSKNVKLFDVEAPLIAKKFKAGHEKEERTSMIIKIIKRLSEGYLSEATLKSPNFQPNSAFDAWRGWPTNES